MCRSWSGMVIPSWSAMARPGAGGHPGLGSKVPCGLRPGRRHNGLMAIRVFLLDDHELVRRGIPGPRGPEWSPSMVKKMLNETAY